MTKPTDEDIIALATAEGIKVRTGKGAVRLVRAALAKWGTPPATNTTLLEALKALMAQTNSTELAAACDKARHAITKTAGGIRD